MDDRSDHDLFVGLILLIVMLTATLIGALCTLPR